MSASRTTAGEAAISLPIYNYGIYYADARAARRCHHQRREYAHRTDDPRGYTGTDPCPVPRPRVLARV